MHSDVSWRRGATDGSQMQLPFGCDAPPALLQQRQLDSRRGVTYAAAAEGEKTVSKEDRCRAASYSGGCANPPRMLESLAISMRLSHHWTSAALRGANAVSIGCRRH